MIYRVRLQFRGKRILTDEIEDRLARYFVEISERYYGLTKTDARKLTYKFAVDCECDVPLSWRKSEQATKEWIANSFLPRHPAVQFRSLLHKQFKESDLEEMHKNLQNILQVQKLSPKDIWNVDEIELRLNRDRIVKKTDKRLTVVLTVNAQGDSLPPFFILPVRHFEKSLLRDCPCGSAGRGNTTGLIQIDDFISYLQHFKQLVKPSQNHQCLLMLDNHLSHMSFGCLNFCKRNGIMLLSFPPYDNIYQLQPLERGVVGLFKKSVYNSIDKWERENLDKPVNVSNVLRFIRDAYATTVTRDNIVEGFRSTGIWPPP